MAVAGQLFPVHVARAGDRQGADAAAQPPAFELEVIERLALASPESRSAQNRPGVRRDRTSPEISSTAKLPIGCQGCGAAASAAAKTKGAEARRQRERHMPAIVAGVGV